MNPSYSSGPSNSGVNPGAISSGPDVPQGGGNSGGGFGGFDFNNFLQNIPKKWLAIAGGALVLILIIVVIVMGMGGKKDTSNKTTQRDLTGYYKYANYVLNGEETTNANLGSYDKSKSYSVITAVSKKDKSFFDKAQELWSPFYELVVNDENVNSTSKLAGDMNWQNQLMDFLAKYTTVTEWTEEDLLTAYAKDGAKKVADAAEKEYGELANTKYKPGAEYAKAMVNWIKMVLKIYTQYESSGCLKAGVIDDGCVATKNTTELMAQYEKIEKNLSVNRVDAQKLALYLAENCFTLQSDLGGSN